MVPDTILVDSPCVGICKLEYRTDVCIGCGRTAIEIEQWATMTNQQRQQVLDRIMPL